MTPEECFKAIIKSAAEEFKKIPQNEPIKLISHLDCDGLTSCSIMIKAMNTENRRYNVSILQQLDKAALTELSKETYKYILFTDLGSGHLNAISTMLKDKKVFVLDHHIPESTEAFPNIIHVNPHLAGVDGNGEISAAGVAYLFASSLNKKLEETASIAIIGAIGDMQEKNGFIGLNNEILKTALANSTIEMEKGLRIFGRQTRPLHKVLEYTTDPYIPGVTGSESGAIQFLHNIRIEPRNGAGWKKIISLNQEEMQRLIAGIIMLRVNEVNPEDILGNIYTLKKEPPESPLRDAKEFSTLLNACGRLNKPSLGIGACIGDSSMKNSAIDLMAEYKRIIVNAMKWFEDNKNTEHIIKGDKYIIINAKDFILSTIIGTLASMVSKSSQFKESTYILAMAQQLTGKIKVSLRLSGYKPNHEIDLRAVVNEIIENIEGCEFGGHENAAGAILPLEKESEFIEKAVAVLSKKSIEENIG